MRVKVKLNEMVEARAAFVSLVSRGANRIPFRMVKADKTQQEHHMIDLSKPASALKAAAKKEDAPAVVVTGVVVIKAEGTKLEAIKAAVKEAGFSVEKMQDLEGAVMFAQVDGDPEDGADAIRMSGDTVVTVKGFNGKKAKPFAKQMKAEDFYPGLDVAAKHIEQAVKAGTPVEGYADYIEAMQAVPAQAYKLDKLVSDAIKAAKPDAEDAEDDPAKGGDGGADEAEEDDAKAKDKAAAKADETAVKTDAPAAPAAPTFDLATVVKAATEEVTKTMEPQLKALSDTIANLTLAMQGVVKQQKELSTKADAHDKALKGTVVGGDQGGDRPSATWGEAAKSDGGVEWITDTAMQSRSKK